MPPYTGPVPKPTLSDAIQDYLKEIYKLQTDERPRLASRRSRGSSRSRPPRRARWSRSSRRSSSPSTRPTAASRLTPAGEQVALEVIRHHRLLELYLAETLGLHVDDVHDEADRLEHVLSEELEARIDKALGFPTHDPHGDPIPNANLEWPKELA